MTLIDFANKICGRMPLYVVNDYDLSVIEINNKNLCSINFNYIFYKDEEGEHFVPTTNLLTNEEVEKEIKRLKKKKANILRNIRKEIERLQQIEEELKQC